MVPLVEESLVDRRNRRVVTYTRNVGLSRFMSAVERVVYTAHPDDPTTTVAVKEAWIESGLYGVRSAVKSFGIERFKQNCQRATEGFNFVLERLYSRQNYLNERWREMRERGCETAKYAAGIAKAHSTLHASDKDST